MNIDIFHETVSSLSQVLNFFLNFHSLRISIIYVSILAFCQVLLNEYDDDDDYDEDNHYTVFQKSGTPSSYR